MPLALPGTCVIVYEKPKVHTSWGAHGVDAWYVSPACNHYKCYTVYILATKQEGIPNTVEFFHHLLTKWERSANTAEFFNHQFQLPTFNGQHAVTSA
eukprot:1738408-Ditylum_brightwellii.AAC.1